MEKEIWKDIKGYEGLYQVSNCGRVKSLSRGSKYYGEEGKFLKGINNRGYLRVSLCKNGKSKTYQIHRLVAEAFIRNPKKMPQINHKDENPLNNCVNNLEWCSANYNCNYGTRNIKISRISKYTNTKPIMCIETRKIYISLNECSREMNIKAPNIWASMNNYNRTKKVKGYTFKYVNLNDILRERDLYGSILKEIKSFIEVDLKKRSDFEIEPKTANYLLEKIGSVLKD